MKPTVHIENWRELFAGTGGSDATILTGNVLDHPRFASGTFVYTSRVLGKEGNRVETRNTIYILGKPADANA